MNVGNVAQVATSLANQRVNDSVDVAVMNIAKDQAKAQGQAVMQLIDSVPKPQGSLGHHINVRA
jgi:hypothetical protein